MASNAPAASAAGSRRPNIVLVMSHDSGRHLNCYGVRTVRTPHLDSLAAQGVRFERCFCTAPSCSPSRASLFTGRYPHCNGVLGLTHGDFGWDLHPDERHLAQVLRDAGYHTVGGGHLHESRRTPEQMGFQERLAATARCGVLAPKAAEWLRNQAPSHQPFFMEVSFFESHRMAPADYYGHPPDASAGVTVPPYLVDTEEARKEFASYQGALAALDTSVGEILTALEQTGQADNTIFLFTADHGIPFPRAKCSLYDPGIEVSLLMRWPQARWPQSGKPVPHMVSNVDILPSLLEMIGLPVAPNVQGHSFAPLLAGAAYEPRREIFAEMTYHQYCDPMRCIRTDTHKLKVNFSMSPAFMDPSQMWRPNTITQHPANPAGAMHVPVELYDLQHDPLERNNLVASSEHQKVLKELLTRLHQWMVDTHDPLLEGIPTPPNHQRALTALKTGAPA